MVSEAFKRGLAQKLNDFVDLPVLGEEQEQMVAEKLVELCLGSFEQIVPSNEALDSMAQEEGGRGAGEPSMQQSLQARIVKQINGMINVPFADEEQEAKILNMIVDALLKVRGKSVYTRALVVHPTDHIPSRHLCSFCIFS